MANAASSNKRHSILGVLLLGQAAAFYVFVFTHSAAMVNHAVQPPPHLADLAASGLAATASSSLMDRRDLSPLSIPMGQPPNLPRMEVEGQKSESKIERGMYGGKNDGKHLGGFVNFDAWGVSPTVWSNMMTKLGVKSLLDVGCGRGTSSRWFLEHKVKVLCVEGSKDAVSKSFLPTDLIVEHDYSRGPWWPRDTYDAVWNVEFLEHVSRQYQYNYIQTFRKAALIFVTSSRFEGWHHVEVHEDDWWIRKFTSFGFVYDDFLTQQVRQWARDDRTSNYTLPTGGKPDPQHISRSMKVFINPAVASLPAHAHLFPDHGCLGKKIGERRADYERRKCGTGPAGAKETPLPDNFYPLPVLPEMHERWIQAIKPGITAA
jgi:hypothetical protein